jgi:hypothetical protein
VSVSFEGTFAMEGGTIQGSTDSGNLTKNTATNGSAAISVDNSASATWGKGGTYTKGGVQTDGGEIVSTDDTLIAMP